MGLDLFKKYRDFVDQESRRQLVFKWILSNRLLDSQSGILINLFDFKEFYALKSVSGRAAFQQRIEKIFPSPSIQARFILCRKGALKENLSTLGEEGSPKEWICLFHSVDLEVWERPKKSLALRHGLEKGERTHLLTVARLTLNHFLMGRVAPTRLSTPEGMERLRNVMTVDVSLWRGGHLQGSKIIQNLPLVEAVVEASKRAARDSRFKPLNASDMENVRIEICAMSDLLLPLSEKEFEDNVIDSSRGYMLRASRTLSEGWYVPAVFNTARFDNLTHLVNQLALQKAGLAPGEKNYTVFAFEVEDFIEDSHRRAPLSLHGPVPASFDFPVEPNIRVVAQNTHAWLVQLQDPDGFFPVKIDPFEEVRPTADWVRLAFCALVLIEYAILTRSDSDKEVFVKLYDFLLEANKDSSFSKSARLLFYAYLGQAALLAEDVETVLVCGARLERKLATATDDAILFSQAAVLFKEASRLKPAWKGLSEVCLSKVEALFDIEVSKGSSSLAAYAELLTLFAGQEEPYRRVLRWYEDQQNPNGSFPDSPRSTHAYSRGTAKVFEALAADHTNKVLALKALGWLSTMQYNFESAYCVPERSRSQMVGGVRESDLNMEAWIDAAAHTLRGCLRLLKQKGESRQQVPNSTAH